LALTKSKSPLGAGGMGEVYRARDTRLDRTVAIKVLNAQLVGSAELRARFEREAKVISQLQHPHICVLHDVGALFKATTVVGSVGPYTASADGKKFVMNTVPPQTTSEPLTLITDWPADLKQ
jgi:serine/threonine protein kinase